MGSSGLPQTGVELVAKNLQGFLGDLSTGNQAVTGFGRNMDVQAGQTSSASQIMIGALRKVGEIAVDTMIKAGRALVDFGRDSLQLAGDFQQGMQQFQVAAGQDLDTAGLQQFHDLFLQLGKDLPVSTSEVQQAATEMVKGGIEPAILAAGGLKSNIQFAAAAMSGDLVGAAEISSKIVAGWSEVNATAADKAELLAHAQDILTKAANASSVNVHELSLGLFNVQATAKNAGIGLDDVTTVLGELAGDFASSSEAGNSLANFITRLHPTTKAATEAMEGLNLITKDGQSVFYDAQGNFVGFRKASELLQESLKGLNNEQRQQVMQTIFQKDAMGVAAGLASRGAEGYDAMAASLSNAMGVTQAGQTIQAGYNTALENAMGSIEALKITLGEAFLPVFTDFLNNVAGPGVSAITTFAGTFVKMIPSIMESEDPLQTFINALKIAAPSALDVITTVEGIKDAIDEIIPPIEDITQTFTEWLPVIEGVVAALGTFVIISAVTGWITGAVAAVTSLGAAMTAAGGGIAGVVAILGGPVTLAIGAVALAIGALVVAWQNNWGDIQGKTAAVWSFLEPIFNQVVDWFEVAIPAAIQVASDFWTTTLWPALQNVGNFIEGTIFPILGDLANVWLALASAEVEALSALWTNVLWPALKVVGAFIGDVLWPIFQKLFEVEFAIAMKVGEALAGLWQKVLYPALQAVGSYIVDTVIPTFKKIGDYLSVTFGPILSGLTEWLNKVTGGFSGISGAVQGVVKWLGDLATNISNLKLPSWLTPGSPTPWEIALRGIGAALNETVNPALGTMSDAVSDAGSMITEAFIDTDLVNVITELGEDAMRGFGKGLKAGMRNVMALIESTADTVEDAFRGAFEAHSPSERMVPVGSSIPEGIMQGILSLWPEVEDLVSSLSDDLMESMDDIGDQVQSILADSFNATASIDRQKVANEEDLSELSEKARSGVQEQLNAVEKEAMSMTDPEQAKKWFQLRSKQMIELAKINEQIQEADDAKERERLVAKYQLINAAQQAEMQAFKANMAAQDSPLQGLIKQLGELFQGGLPVNDTGAGAQLNKLFDLLQSLLQNTNANGIYTPPMMPGQYQAGGTGNTYSSQNTYNMPIYTNQSLAALQQSFALMQALAAAQG